MINLKEGIKSSNARQYLLANIPKWYPVLADQPPETMRAHRVGALLSSLTTDLKVPEVH